MEHPENNEEYKGLTVNSGVEQPSIVNPYLKRGRFRRREMTVAEMVDGIVKGDVTILSQAVTLVESVNPAHQQKAQEVIEKCLPYSGSSIRIGISGVPGAGKSTSIDQFGIHVLERTGGKLAVLAIDPSSERSKGSENLQFLLLTQVLNAARAAYLATRHAWRNCLCIPMPLFALRQRLVLLAVWHARRASPSSSARQQALTRFSWRPLEWGRARPPVTQW